MKKCKYCGSTKGYFKKLKVARPFLDITFSTVATWKRRTQDISKIYGFA